MGHHQAAPTPHFLRRGCARGCGAGSQTAARGESRRHCRRSALRSLRGRALLPPTGPLPPPSPPKNTGRRRVADSFTRDTLSRPPPPAGRQRPCLGCCARGWRRGWVNDGLWRVTAVCLQGLIEAAEGAGRPWDACVNGVCVQYSSDYRTVQYQRATAELTHNRSACAGG